MSSSRKYSQYNTTYSNFTNTPKRNSKTIFQSSSRYVLTQPSSTECPLFKNYVEHNKLIAARKSRNNHSISGLGNMVRPDLNNMDTMETIDTRHLLLSKKRREIKKNAETIIIINNVYPIHHGNFIPIVSFLSLFSTPASPCFSSFSLSIFLLFPPF